MRRAFPVVRYSVGFVLAVLCAPLLACKVSEQEEMKIGRDEARQINEQLPLVQDSVINEYVQSLGQRIAARTSRANLDWHFSVVDSPEINAFAIPGGYVWVNRGLIERTEHMDQLAGTLGHEIGHIVRRHSVKQVQRAGGAKIGIAILCNFTGACDSRAARIAIDVGGAAWLARHSRKDEAEADSEAVANVARAGIDPRGIPDLFRLMLDTRKRQPDRLATFFASHPLEEQRLAETTRLVNQLPHTPRSNELIVDDESFQEIKRRLAALPPAPAEESRSLRRR
jgi:predicted Zn-dependent protease